MRVIEVQEFTPDVGKGDDATQFPGLGAFVDKLGILRLVYRLQGSSTPYVMHIGVVAEAMIKEVEEPQPSMILESREVGGMVANDILKLVAIIGKPELAVELTK